MGQMLKHPMAMDGGDPSNVRGDRMDGARYYDPEFAKLEWERMWTRIWHVAGRESEIPEAGDYIIHDFRHESVFAVRQENGSVRAFYNSCGHRGQRLVWNASHAEAFHCPYHGWKWGKDGLLEDLPDQENFPQGNPCGTLRLAEARCDTWGGFIWYTMDDDAPPLLEYLSPTAELYKNYPLDRMLRVGWVTIELDTNWKFVSDNFGESYHTRTAHPQLAQGTDQDYWNAQFDMFPMGHARIVQMHRPSLRDQVPEGVVSTFDKNLIEWGIDPASYPDYETKALQGWEDLLAAKRRLSAGKGRPHYAQMTDEELSVVYHTVLFPNVTLTLGPDTVTFWRSEPHPDDPNKSTLDIWTLAYPIEGATEIGTMLGMRPLVEAPACQRYVFNPATAATDFSLLVSQDLGLAVGQQRGLRSRGYRDAYLAAQETRVRRFHEVLNDYIEGRR